MFGRHKTKMISYDKNGKIPVIRASICTGEKVAGFKDEATGKFEDLMVIREDSDLKKFMKQYGVREEEIKKEW
ncbi:MAG: aspartate dehydrogenase [Lachnospiraceae bacterium]|nr:aspartate dehydrogenase [Lachnospiraceae bacterium]